ncbi:hypothetical protein Patl1_14241 [Pistacia atlantica]|uniref:Uncharacterized protein n=1 Tax=Pistacia atlantica TaxID=434234 RepID=A0ACC1AW52_9ROSI|nr:hypothetical protein Patl1_14241 [Pistacia atlantica]
MDVNLPESQEWFPKWVWKKLEKGEFHDMMLYQPEARPCISVVVKMLEEGLEIPAPKNPFPHLMTQSPVPDLVAKYTDTQHEVFSFVDIWWFSYSLQVPPPRMAPSTKGQQHCHRPQTESPTMDKFLNDMEREKPIRFTSQKLRIATDDFTNLLGTGGPQLPADTYVPGSGSTFDLSSSMATGSSFTCATPIMGKYEIEIATST